MRTGIILVLVVFCSVCILPELVLSEATTLTSTTSTTSASTTQSTVTTKATPTTTLTPAEECAKHNSSCDDCMKAGVKCLYCYEDNTCKLYPVGSLLPKSSYCSLSKARWGVCWLNFEALLIAVGVISGIIVLGISCCCIYCCCCRKGSKAKYLKDEAKWEREKQERKQRQSERKADRQERLDEIRRKYGLVKDEPPYERFDT